MSYDIRFAVKVEGAEDFFAVIGEPERHSPTYNLGQMFRACTGWDFKQGVFYKLSEVLPLIKHGIEELQDRPAKYTKYEPDNGWGTVLSAISALESIVNWVSEDNWNGLAGSWNADLPLDCIWIAW